MATRTDAQGRPMIQTRTGGWYVDPRYLSKGRDRNGQPIAPELTPSKTTPSAPNQIRIKNAENIPVFLPIPQNVGNPGGTHRNPTPRPGEDAKLQGKGSDKQFGDALRDLSESEKFLRPSNLTGKQGKTNAPRYVVGSQARLGALSSAEAKIKGDNSPAGNTLRGNIADNKRLALEQRNQVLSVLSQARQKQREAMRVNAEIQTGRKPRRGAAAILPRMPGLLGSNRPKL